MAPGRPKDSAARPPGGIGLPAAVHGPTSGGLGSHVHARFFLFMSVRWCLFEPTPPTLFCLVITPCAGTMWKRFLGPVSPYTETWPNIGPIHPKPLEEKREGRLCPFMCPFHASLHVPLALVAPGPDPSGMLLFMCPWLWWLRDQIPPGCFPSCAPLCAPGSFGSGA